MTAIAMRQPEPTAEQLEAAWLELSATGRHASCSNCTSVHEALARPVTRALIRMHARLVAEGRHPLAVQASALVRPAVIAPEPPPSLIAPRRAKPYRPLRAPQQPAQLDRKRAASGERDDD